MHSLRGRCLTSLDSPSRPVRASVARGAGGLPSRCLLAACCRLPLPIALALAPWLLLRIASCQKTRDGQKLNPKRPWVVRGPLSP